MLIQGLGASVLPVLKGLKGLKGWKFDFGLILSETSIKFWNSQDLDFAIPQNRSDATILREAAGVLPGFPNREVALRVPCIRCRRVDRAVVARK